MNRLTLFENDIWYAWYDIMPSLKSFIKFSLSNYSDTEYYKSIIKPFLKLLLETYNNEIYFDDGIELMYYFDETVSKDLLLKLKMDIF